MDKKKEIRKLKRSAADLIKGLNVVEYKYRDTDDEKDHIGLIAEEAPEELKAPGGKAINLGDSVGVLFRGMQEILERLEKLESGGRK